MSVGFLDAPLGRVRDAFAAWLAEVRQARPAVNLGRAPLVAHLGRLEPLAFTWRRMLLVQTRSAWTAVLLSNSRGADVTPPVSHLSEVLGVRGALFSNVPQVEDASGRVVSFGEVRFDLVSEKPGYFLNHVRTVYVMNDGGRWVFTAQGEPQPFEEPEAYKARKVRDRFTAPMLERYARGLGIELFTPEFYEGEAALLETGDALPPGQKELSLAQARRELGLSA
ncbi:hypothetical protein FGE12_02960 [Aggregicoccus sp. 17bor-14]|uniref:hypothetical protein n=1 Tax=Myxococcaceae TaxID=31 RepID=UPI00129CB435|nr:MULTISPECIES: hypothetical protein [Myxococcaceae]MBF5041331.1 hypothetical protein [Simulacricoccus sp. 17bor-14]MRI87117.1 hypothetical protein [Aggregicoccus sp. 17bor-14]